MDNHIKIGCAADDFTGAGDAASFLARGGLNTVLLNGLPQTGGTPEDTQAAVVALKSRTQETSSAVADSMDAVHRPVPAAVLTSPKSAVKALLAAVKRTPRHA